MTSPAEARVAVERNALAIMRGDLMQVMADLTPEALGQLSEVALTLTQEDPPFDGAVGLAIQAGTSAVKVYSAQPVASPIPFLGITSQW